MIQTALTLRVPYLTRHLGTKREAGGAAMEYIIVSLFGTFLTLAALGYLSQVLQDKLTDIAQELGVAPPSIQLAPWGEHR